MMREEEFNAIVKYASQMAKHETAAVAYRRAHATIKAQLLNAAHINAGNTKAQLQSALQDTTQNSSRLATIFGLSSYIFLWAFPYVEYSRHMEALDQIYELQSRIPEDEFMPDEGDWENDAQSTYANLHLDLSLKLREDFAGFIQLNRPSRLLPIFSTFASSVASTNVSVAEDSILKLGIM